LDGERICVPNSLVELREYDFGEYDYKRMNYPTPQNDTPNGYKLAAFDLDGTILDQGKLSERTKRTLSALHLSGVHVVIATGRHPKMITAVRQSLPFVRYAITSSGAQVLDLQTGEVISCVPLAYELSVALMDSVSREARASNIFIEDNVLIPLSNMFKFRRQLTVKTVRQEVSEFFEWAKFVVLPGMWVRNPRNTVLKLNAFFAKTEQCKAFMAKVVNEFEIEAVSTGGLDVEMTTKGIHKGYGLFRLCEYLQIPLEKTIIFGDSANDIEILRSGGHAVVMENASESVKAVADRIAPHVKRDGAAQVLEEVFGLGV
jgi:Cof subfamily protein (haloacid dehalogenase superfamily)